MKNIHLKNLIFFIAASGPAASGAAGPPFYPQPVGMAGNTAQAPAGATLFRISLSAADEVVEKSVRIGNITVCSQVACYRPMGPTKDISVFSAKAGTAESLPIFAVPAPLTINSIHFEDSAGSNVVAGDIRLSNPVQIEAGAHGGEVMVLIRGEQRGARRIYHPTAAVGGLFSPARKSVFYNPKFGATTSLDRDTSLSIPAGATDGAQIFSVAIHDTGDKYPMVDVYPSLNLRVPASIKIKPIDRGVPPAGAANSTLQRQVLPATTRPVRATGVIRFESSIDEQWSGSATAAAIPSPCAAVLGTMASRINSALSTTGSVYISACESMVPYVHTAKANNMVRRTRLSLNDSFSGNGSYLSLRQIES